MHVVIGSVSTLGKAWRGEGYLVVQNKQTEDLIENLVEEEVVVTVKESSL